MDDLNDFYLHLIGQHWDKIVMMYRAAPKRPIMVYELPSQRIYSYPYKGYKNSLNARSQVMLKQQYRQARRTNGMVIFVKDNDNEILKSFMLPL